MSDLPADLTSNMNRVRFNSANTDNAVPRTRKTSTKALIKKSHKLKKQQQQQQDKPRTLSCSASKILPSNSNNNNISEQSFSVKTDNNDDKIVDDVVSRLQASQIIQKVKLKQVTRVFCTKNEKRHRHLNRANQIARDRNVGDGTGLRWGNEMDLDNNRSLPLDQNDPNYTSDDGNDSIFEEKVVFYSSLSQEDFEILFDQWLDEYLANGDLENFGDLLMELAPTRQNMKCIPTFCISKILDHKPVQRELVSKLLPFVCQFQKLGHEFLCDSFDLVIDTSLSEFCIDYTDAPEIIGMFFARAVADDLIPPNYIFRHKHITLIPGEKNILAHRVFSKAKSLLDRPHSYAQLDEIWMSGMGLTLAPDGHQPVKKLILAIESLIKDYAKTRNMGYVERTLTDLSIPHFLHELVYQTICIAFKKVKPSVRESLFDFLKRLFHSGYLTIDQVEIGINRVYDNIESLTTNKVPNAPFFLEELLQQGMIDGWISPSIVKNKPTVRRRFISENIQPENNNDDDSDENEV